MHWDGGTENSPENSSKETIQLVYSTVTYIYMPGNTDDGEEGTFSAFNHVNASGGSGTYTPRDPGTPPLFAVTLARDDSLPPGHLRLSWLNDPGIRYALEFTDDWREKCEEVSGQQQITENERVLILPAHLPVGFYRVIEK